MKRRIGLAILGLGTVGSNVLKIIVENQEHILKEYGIELFVKSVYVRDVNKKRKVSLTGIVLTDDIEKIIYDKEVEICIECMGGGGEESTYQIVKRIAEQKKHIIMSSKKCLALHCDEIIDVALENEIQLRYDATVGGCIPICRILASMSNYDEIRKMYGIVNASTNFLQSLIEDEGKGYEEALVVAKEKGFVENDPSEDILGFDTYYKMYILLRFGLGIEIEKNGLMPFNNENVIEMINKSKSSHIKQIFYFEKISRNKIGLYVGPADVNGSRILRNVDYSNNVICLEQKYAGIRSFVGRGAGGKETASTMIEDLLDIATGKINNLSNIVKKLEIVKLSNDKLSF